MKRIFTFLLCLVLLTVCFVQPSFADTTVEEDQKALKSLQKQLDSIKAEKKSIESQLAKAKNDKSQQQKAISLMYSEIDSYQTELDLINTLVYEYTDLINQKEEQITELNIKLEKNYELFKERIVFAQESGNLGYIDFILGSADVSDILSRSEVISDLLKYDKEIITAISNDKKEIELAKEEIENTLELCKEKQEEYKKTTEVLKGKIADAESYLKKYENDVAVQNAKLAEQNKLKSNTEKRISELNDQINVKLNKDYDATFIWPLPVTFPGYISQKFKAGSHTGLDIATNGRNGSVPVLACAAGTVSRTGSYWDWGNLVVIKHDNTISTYYAHLYSYSVSVNQQVKKGQQIGLVGTTGHSTGPHLHLVFEVKSYNASTKKTTTTRVDPLKYIKKP